MKGQRLAWGSMAAWAAASAGMVLAPGVNVPGYLQAFACGVAAPLLLAAPLMALARRLDGRVAWAGLWCVVAGALLGAMPGVVTTMVGAARDTLCAVKPAWLHVVLGPVLAGAVVGATARLVTAWVKPGWRAGAAYLGILAVMVGHTLYGLYAQPQVFALDHYFGHFRGPLYDEGNPSFERPLVLRAVSIAYVACLLSAARLSTSRSRETWLLAGLAALGWGGMHLAASDVLQPGRAGLLAVLSTPVTSDHAVIHLDGARWTPPQRQRLAAEVERHITELKEQLGLHVEVPVDVFLYASSEEKFRLLGASSTLLARPWAHEIHVQGGAVPIGALRHELAHVLLAEVSGGPLGVSGLIPNLLLIEGMATALEEDESRLTLMEQAALMKKMGRLPSMLALARPWGFVLESSARAYTAAGAFLRFVGEQRGGATLAAVYREGSLPDDVAAMEAQWHAFLDGLEVPPQGVGAQYKRLFKRASVVERRCVDEAAELWTRARTAASARQWGDAEAGYRRILSLDDGDDEPLLQLLEVLGHADDGRGAARVAAELVARGPDAVATSRMAQAQAEGAERAERWADAAAALEQALPLVTGSATERSVRIQQFLVAQAQAHGATTPQGEGARAALRFMVGDGPERARGRSDLLALERAFVVVGNDDAGRGIRSLLRYLLGRQLVSEDPARAEAALAQAVELGLPVELLQRETARLRGEAAENATHLDAAAQHYQEAQRLSSTAAERAETAVLLKRARFAGGFLTRPSR